MSFVPCIFTTSTTHTIGANIAPLGASYSYNKSETKKDCGNSSCGTSNSYNNSKNKIKCGDSSSETNNT